MKNKKLFIIILALSIFHLGNAQTLLDTTALYPAPVSSYWGYINYEGKMIIEPTYDYAYDFNGDGLAVVMKQKLYGVLQLDGTLAVPLSYRNLKKCSKWKDASGACFIAYNGVSSGVINAKNEVLIPFEYESIKEVSNTLLAVRKKKHWGLVNKKHDLIEPTIHRKITTRWGAKEVVMYQDTTKKWGVYTTQGQKVCHPMFNYLYCSISKSIISGETDAGLVKIDYNGKQMPCSIKVENFWLQDYAVAQDTTGLYGMVNHDYEWIVYPKYQQLKYDNYQSKNSIVLAANESKKWGAIRLDGELVLPMIYQRIDYVMGTLLALSEDAEWTKLYDFNTATYLNDITLGHVHGYSYLDIIEACTAPKSETTSLTWGVMNAQGKWILAPNYYAVNVINQQLAVVEAGIHSATGIYDFEEKCFLIPPVFSSIQYNFKGLTKVRCWKNKIAYINPNGSIVWAEARSAAKFSIEDYYK